MPIHEHLQRVATAAGGAAVIILALPDGNEIACASEAQARSMEGLWWIFSTCRRELAIPIAFAIEQGSDYVRFTRVFGGPIFEFVFAVPSETHSK